MFKTSRGNSFVGIGVIAVLFVSLSFGARVSADKPLAVGADEPGVQSSESDVRQDQRHVPLDGQANFRDIGGYQGADGKVVAMGRVYRSGRLASLTDADVNRVAETGVRTVVDFLTEKEIRSGEKDRLPEGCAIVSLPIESDNGLAATLVEARKTGDFSKIDASLNPEIHRMLVRQATDQYAALMRTILNSEDPIVFHCSHGVHRTGTAAAILLWTLGVSWDDIREDYLLSNHYRRDEVQKRIDQLRQLTAKSRGIPPAAVDMTNVSAFYRLQPQYIDATRDVILEEYGGIEGYLTRGLKLSPAEIERLRQRLLVKHP